MMTKEERKNVNEELVALLLSFSEKQTAEILKAVTQDHFWDLPESEQVELLRRCIHESSDCGKSGRPEKQSPVVAAKGSQAVSLNLRECPQISGVAG